MAIVLCVAPSLALPAFPGAVGHGSETPGGRGGQVAAVTTLEDDVAGSLRAACNLDGPRIIVFKVGGTIELLRSLSIDNPYVTIAGQTAPGDGIAIRGASLNVATHDVVIRNLRFRVGDGPDGPEADNRDGVSVGNSSASPYNVIIDHCSIAWAIDENLSTWHSCHDITFSWCISAEALSNSLHSKGEHSKGLLIGDHSYRITVHHNLFAHNMRRSPLLKAGTSAEVVNNVVYNWGTAAMHHSNYEGTNEPIFAHFVANLLKPGADSRATEIFIPSDMSPGSQIYVQGNIGPRRPVDTLDEWALVSGAGSFRIDLPIDTLRSVTAEGALTAYQQVLARAGAVVPARDAVDHRVVQSVLDSTGRIIDSQSEVGGWPVMEGGTAPSDTDGDGMPNVWESSRGLSVSVSDAAGNDLSVEGYTNIEVYVNSLVDTALAPSVVASRRHLVPRANRPARHALGSPMRFRLDGTRMQSTHPSPPGTYAELTAGGRVRLGTWTGERSRQ